ncbi:MAG: hypothetical protein V4682_02970 [Patescibacteria group bacterium]
MADRLRIPNPLQENDIKILSLTFDTVDGGEIVIEATNMNLAGRLFFQDAFSGPGFRACEVEFFEPFFKRAEEYFAELWHDRANRALLSAFSVASYVVIDWKKM